MKHITKTVWWHWQNLAKPHRGFWHGRVWIHGERSEFRICWSHGKHVKNALAAHISVAGGDNGRDLSFHVAIPRLFSWFVTFNYPWFERWMPGKMVDSIINPGTQFKIPTERQIGAWYSEGTIWIQPWAMVNEWNRGDPWWWSITINIPDLLLGRSRLRDTTELDKGTLVVPMPECDYAATYVTEQRTYKRNRWPWKKVVTSMNVDMETPIPIPGKGENAWDCGDDAIWSVSFSGTSPEHAAAKVRASAMRDRQRYGGPEWSPVQNQ